MISATPMTTSGLNTLDTLTPFWPHDRRDIDTPSNNKA
jgi:hypothetical protein